MENQSAITSLSPKQLDSLTDNLAEAMQTLFKSVATREISRRIKIGLEVKKMKDGEKEYGEYTRI